jgi:hypothetical protein
MIIGVAMIGANIDNTAMYVFISNADATGIEDQTISILDVIAGNIMHDPPKKQNEVLNGLVILRDECAISFSPFHATLLGAAICYMQGQVPICPACAGLTLGV